MREIRTKNGKMRRYRSAEEVAALLKEFSGSGLSQSKFARSRGINLNVLSGWIKRAVPRTEERPAFQEVGAMSGLWSGWAAELALPSGLSLRLSAAADPALAERLWKLISG